MKLPIRCWPGLEILFGFDCGSIVCLFDKNRWVNCVMSVMIYDLSIPPWNHRCRRWPIPIPIIILILVLILKLWVTSSHNFRYLFAALPFTAAVKWYVNNWHWGHSSPTLPVVYCSQIDVNGNFVFILIGSTETVKTKQILQSNDVLGFV